MKIIIEENIDNLAAHYFVDSLGEIPKENEALFTRMRVKKQLETAAEVIENEENGGFIVKLDIKDILFKDGDTLIDRFFLDRWEKAYKRAIVDEVKERLQESEVVTNSP